MHSYRKNKDRFEVIFDPGAPEFEPPVLAEFDQARHAAMLVHYLNGGSSFSSIDLDSLLALGAAR